MNPLLYIFNSICFLMLVVRVYLIELETELCDLNFINDEERKNAHSEFISVNLTDAEWPPHNPNISKGRHHLYRRKRQVLNSNNRVKTIETAIFVDAHLNQRFQGRLHDLKRLVMATMNEVQLIYSYDTMKVPIRIVISKFEVLNSNSDHPSNAGGDIDKYLDNFCSWQAKKFKSTNYETRWDHALMLTGLDLFKEAGGKRNKKVLGLAWVNGMCKPAYSCTLNEGKSFEAAFVIAHEMGHSLGILHDGRGNNCDPEKYIMSEKTGPGKVNWSPCSNKYLENFLGRGNGRCLENAAAAIPDLDFGRVSRLPGEQYTPDLQCQLALGSQYKAYHSAKEPFNDVCRELWCLSGSWATPAHPALEGSSCGTRGEKCFQGTCAANDQRVSASRRRSVPPNPPGFVPGVIGRPALNPSGQAGNNRRNSRIRIGFGFVNRRRGISGRDASGSLTSPDNVTQESVENSSPSNPLININSGRSLNVKGAEESPIIHQIKGFITSLLPEANKIFNLFSVQTVD